MDDVHETKVLSQKMLMMLVVLPLALFSVSAWAHEGEASGDTTTSATMSQQIPAPTSHLHETSLVNSCPQLEDETDTAGLRQCVTTLTSQISDLLRLIMNLSDALAESQNELMRHDLHLQGAGGYANRATWVMKRSD
jgi:hypothetical protein